MGIVQEVTQAHMWACQPTSLVTGTTRQASHTAAPSSSIFERRYDIKRILNASGLQPQCVVVISDKNVDCFATATALDSAKKIKPLPYKMDLRSLRKTSTKLRTKMAASFGKIRQTSRAPDGLGHRQTDEISSVIKIPSLTSAARYTSTRLLAKHLLLPDGPSTHLKSTASVVNEKQQHQQHPLYCHW
ncbi:hypothetical protein TRVL_10285 [Trypanosoma vivax]|nr:hypothetical protein TRVL_10285 [Trypanosoma vivax]